MAVYSGALIVEDAEATYANISARLRDVSADMAPNITVDGVTIDRMSYYRTLMEMKKLAREDMLAALGPFEVRSVVR